MHLRDTVDINSGNVLLHINRKAIKYKGCPLPQITHKRQRGLEYPAINRPHDVFRINSLKGTDEMDKYVCSICGYEYDPEVGDPKNGIAPGTAFEDLPAEWTCPVCGAGKEDFEKE